MSATNPDAIERLMSVGKDVYTPDEIAELFDNVTIDQVRGAVYRGQLKAVRDGERIVGIHRADFLAWLSEKD